MSHLQQGKYTIKGNIIQVGTFRYKTFSLQGALFQTEYDPLHVIMRSTKRAQFQNSLERFAN